MFRIRVHPKDAIPQIFVSPLPFFESLRGFSFLFQSSCAVLANNCLTYANSHHERHG